MSTLFQSLQNDLNASRKAQDKPRTLLLGTIVSDVKNRQIELRRELTDEEVVEVLQRGIKRRRESAEAYEKGGREELAERERAEVVILEGYLPQQADPDEIRTAVRTAVQGGAAQIGAVMAAVMPQFKGRADGSIISAIVREELAAGK